MIDIARKDLITGDGFRQIAKTTGLIYVSTHELPDLISKIRSQTRTVNVLTHRSDGCILPLGQTYHPRPMERTEDFTWHNIPSNIQWWFAQNCDVWDDRLVFIPIGVENDEWSLPARKKEIILTLRKLEVRKRGLVYLNVNPVTNFIRPHIYHLFSGKKWCTVEYGKHGVDFENFAQKIWSHKFVFAPEGNGMDTHRPWEALYLGSYPIVKRRCFTTEFAKHLPILVVDSWEQVTRELLEAKYQEFSHRNWDWGALKMDYWKNLIENKLREDLPSSSTS